MRIAIVGTGYVGLVTGACLSDFGHDVICIDKDPERIDALNQGMMPIFETGLAEIIRRSVAGSRISFSLDLKSSISNADVVFLAVGTPARKGDGHADLSFVYAAAAEVGAAIKNYTVVVTKSTVPVGTGDEIERIIRETSSARTFAVVSNPEFLREGSAIDDFKRPDRIVIGTDNAQAEAVMRSVYRPLFLHDAPILITGRRSAELIKYAANAFLATKITFINEISDLCEQVGADVHDVARGMGLDNRIGRKFLHAGPGFGGSCFPKDTLALIKTAQDCGAPMRVVEIVAAVNDQRRRAMGRRIIMACGGNVRGKTIALLGLTFKPNTDDMRDSPSIAIIAALRDAGAHVRAYDPEGMEAATAFVDGIEFADNAYACVTGADALAVVTEWNAFRGLDLVRVRELLRRPVVIDLRNVYRPDEMRQLGFDYHDIGRAYVTAPSFAIAAE